MFLWICYHDNSKLRASILAEVCLWVKVVTTSSSLNFGRSTPLGRGLLRAKFLAPPYYSQHAVFASPLSSFFISSVDVHTLVECDGDGDDDGDGCDNK